VVIRVHSWTPSTIFISSSVSPSFALDCHPEPVEGLPKGHSHLTIFISSCFFISGLFFPPLCRASSEQSGKETPLFDDSATCPRVYEGERGRSSAFPALRSFFPEAASGRALFLSPISFWRQKEMGSSYSPSTILISSSFSPYSSYTIASIWLSMMPVFCLYNFLSLSLVASWSAFFRTPD
jgi:hypothetical protein